MKTAESPTEISSPSREMTLNQDFFARPDRPGFPGTRLPVPREDEEANQEEEEEQRKQEEENQEEEEKQEEEEENQNK